MPNWKKVITSGSDASLNSLTASNGMYGTASYAYTASYLPNAVTFPYTGSALISGSLTVTGSVGISGSISTININNGYPTSNAWQSGLNGSYFNNFTPDTNVSEILRFIAGLLSSSAPNPLPNARVYNSPSSSNINASVGSVPAGSIPQSSTNNTVNYLNSKGFANAGSTIFNGISTIYNNFAFGQNFTSTYTGTTTVSSSTNAFGLGLLSSGAVTSFKVSGSFNFKFKDNSNKIDTSTSSSFLLLTQATEGTSNGVTLAKIPTSNPAVIPSAYQDGYYSNIFPISLYSGSIGSGGATGSGWYHLSASIAIASGSSPYTSFTNNYTEIFYAPLTAINSGIPNNTITIGSPTTTTSGSYTAVSRSLSGAPYLTSATYYISSSISGMFNPLFYAGTTAASITVTGTGISYSNTSLTTTGGVIGSANMVYDSTNTTARAASSIPFETDVVRQNASITFSVSAGETNISQTTTLSPTTFTSNVIGRDRGASSTSTTYTFGYHNAGTFGQPSSSGSLAYYGRAQAYDNSTYSASSAGSVIINFTGENRRLQVNDKILSGSYSLGDAWITASYSAYTLTSKDLQIKPGYLVKPGGTYGYWLADPGASTYKYAAFGFTRNISTNQPSTTITLTGNTTLVQWTDTTADRIAMLIIPKSVLAVQTSALGIDPKAPSTTTLAAGNAQNPFGVSLEVRANTNTYPTVDFPAAYPLDTTYRDFVVLIRYNGDPTPLQTITMSISS